MSGFDGDRRSDVFVYDAARGNWSQAFTDAAGRFRFASGSWDAGWSIATSDFNADGRTDLFLFGRSAGTWFQVISGADGGSTYASGRWDPGWSVLTH